MSQGGFIMSDYWKDNRGFCERNAGKLLISAFVVGAIFFGLSNATGSAFFVVCGGIIWVILVIASLIGYSLRG